MPELEPQVAPAAPVVHQPPPIKKNKELDLKSNLLPSKDDIKKSKSKEEKKEERKKEQKSIKEFFLAFDPLHAEKGRDSLAFVR